MQRFNRPVWAWAMYDWANSTFATTVMAGFFPVFFKQYWNAGVEAQLSTFRLGVANSAASLVVLVLAPVLGAIADAGGAKKRFLITMAFLGIAASAALPLAGAGEWGLASALYVVGLIGFSGANVFYDALLVDVAPEAERHVVSGLGYAMGYLGGGLLFALNVATTVSPATFGLADSAQAVRVSFVSVALWWALFSIPVMLWVHEPRRQIAPAAAIRRGLRQLVATWHEARRLRTVAVFLVAYWLYIDGVDTIIRMAVDYGLALGFEANALIVALLITQFVGFPAAIAFGYLGQRLGPKTGILIGLAVYVAVTVFAYFMHREQEFYVLAVAVGLVQGGVQALSRSLYSQLIPPARSAEFFGFYNMLGKFAAIIGPLLVGVVTLTFGDERLGLLSIVILFIAGAALLIRVDVAAGRSAAIQL